jgi:serine/threonine protein phosphatase 1
MTAESLARAPIVAGRSVPAGTAVYAIGDIHGRADLLETLHRMIAEDAALRRSRRRVAVYLGDYVDRGPNSAAVIDLILDKTPEGFDVVTLIGNHEQLMIDFFDDFSAGPLWLRNGGVETLASYGIEAVEGEFAGDTEYRRLQAELGAKLPRRHRDFLGRLSLMHVEGDYLFVHAGIRPGVAIEDQRPEDLIWIRAPFLNSTADHGRTVVHGHTILPEPQFMPHRIGIDTGAFFTGHLTCLALEGTSQRILQTSG